MTQAAPVTHPYRTPTPYKRRRPEQTVLCKVVQEHLETFLGEGAARSEHGFGYPAYVKEEFEAFLRCGLLQAGFSRLVCESCEREHLVAFSCKSRGFCPSCMGRRMTDTAKYLVENVLPVAPYRQWTLAFPRAIRFPLLRDREKLTAVLNAFLRTVFAWQRRKARALGITQPLCASVTLLQRFGSRPQATLTPTAGLGMACSRRARTVRSPSTA
jgi:hypothetical protein